MPDFPPGTPSWVELSSPDTDAAAEFYGRLMGWTATVSYTHLTLPTNREV